MYALNNFCRPYGQKLGDVNHPQLAAITFESTQVFVPDNHDSLEIARSFAFSDGLQSNH